jgi:hypothetical protein
MNNHIINYKWLFFAEKLIKLAKEFKEKREDCKNLPIYQIILEKFDLHDFILNKKPIEGHEFEEDENENYLYLENLISHALTSNQTPQQVSSRHIWLMILKIMQKSLV